MQQSREEMMVEEERRPFDVQQGEKLKGSIACGRRRRVRKVVYYYSDSDEEMNPIAECNPDSLTDGASDVGQPCCGCCHQKKEEVSPHNPRIGSPTPIGLYAFGITTMLFSVHLAGIFTMNLFTVGMLVWYGGAAQFVAGFFELINKNTLGCTLSTTYGAFWMATATTLLTPDNSFVSGNESKAYLGLFFLLWFFFAGSMAVAGRKLPLMNILLLVCVPLNFLLQSISNFADIPTLSKIAGYEGIFYSALAMYLAMAYSFQDTLGHSPLPLLAHTNFRDIRWE